MSLRWLGICLATAFALTAQTSKAQVRGLPEESAERAAADAQLQSNINNEAAARAAGDAQLQTRINNEAAARAGADGVLLDLLRSEANERRAADEALQAAIGGGGGGGETSIVGRYAVTGGGTCLNSSTGFAANLLPIIFVPPPVVAPPIPGQTEPPPPPPPMPATVLQVTSSSINGVRTFNANGNGTAVSTFTTVNYPSYMPWGTVRIGGGSASTFEGTFTYTVDGDNLIIVDDPPTGIITQGPSAGAQISSLGLPRFVGKISKDRKTIVLTQENVVVEQNVITPLGQAPQITDRICERHRILTRIN